jgi:hypothetical protein
VVQLDLQLEIFKTLSNFEAVTEFQEKALKAIGEVSQEARQKNNHPARGEEDTSRRY